MKTASLCCYSMLFVLLINQSVEAEPFVVQTEVSPINGHTYHLLSPSNWTDAEAVAVGLGGHLATIRSEVENEWIVNTFGDLNTRYLWIGLNDEQTEGTFVWICGEPVKYTNWQLDEPNNSDGQEDHVQLGWGEDASKWNDLFNFSFWGTNDLQGVVEIIPVPEARTLFQCAIAAVVLTAISLRSLVRNRIR